MQQRNKFIPRLPDWRLIVKRRDAEWGKMLRPSLLIRFQMRSFIQSLNWFYADGMIQQMNNEEVDSISSTCEQIRVSESDLVTKSKVSEGTTMSN